MTVVSCTSLRNLVQYAYVLKFPIFSEKIFAFESLVSFSSCNRNGCGHHCEHHHHCCCHHLVPGFVTLVEQLYFSQSETKSKKRFQNEEFSGSSITLQRSHMTLSTVGLLIWLEYVDSLWNVCGICSELVEYGWNVLIAC
jgi:hypothetical protein